MNSAGTTLCVGAEGGFIFASVKRNPRFSNEGTKCLHCNLRLSRKTRITNAWDIHNSFEWQCHGENTEFWVVFFCWRLQAFRPPLHRWHRRKLGQSSRNNQRKLTKYLLDRWTSYRQFQKLYKCSSCSDTKVWHFKWFLILNYNQQDATFLDLFISTDVLRVSGGSSAHHQEHITVHTASGIVNQYCCLLLSWMRWNEVPSHPG